MSKKRKLLLKTVNINLGMFSQNAYKFCLIVTIDIQKLVSQCSRKQKILGLGSQMTTDD